MKKGSLVAALENLLLFHSMFRTIQAFPRLDCFIRIRLLFFSEPQTRVLSDLWLGKAGGKAVARRSIQKVEARINTDQLGI